MTTKNQPFELFGKTAPTRQPKPSAASVQSKPAANHKFKTGQTLAYTPNGLGAETRAGNYRVVSLMPANIAGEHQYRVKSLFDVHERVVRESQLTAV